MKNIKKMVSIVAIVAIVAVVGLGAFSYFTDYATTTLDKANAGTLNIKLSDVTEDLTDGLGILNPGDSNDLTFKVANTAEKSADVKAVITVTATDAAGTAKNMTSIHEYKVTDNEGTELADGDLTDNVLVYTVDGTVLSGSVEEDGTAAEFVYDYQLVMDAACKNEWQDSNVEVKVEIFAKQHRNTSAGWDLIDSFEVVADEVAAG